MATTNPTLDRADQLAPLVHKAHLEPPAHQVLKPHQTPRQFVEALAAAGHFADALRCLAWAMDRRAAVWWACVCVREALAPPVPPAEAAALAAAEKWVASPTEEHRRAAYPAAEALEFSTAPGCVALAAFWSGGSLTPPNLPPVAPAEHLLPTGVVNAITLAAVQKGKDKPAEAFRRFLAVGLAVADGQQQPRQVTGGTPVPPTGARPQPRKN